MENDNRNSDAKDIIEAAWRSAAVSSQIAFVAPDPIQPDAVPVEVDRGGRISVVDSLLKLAPRPRRRQGTSTHAEIESFIAHINRHKEPDSVVWADTAKCRFLAVYNYHPAGGTPQMAGWSDFQAMYSCPLSPEWIAWHSAAGRPMTQEQFADFLDQRMDDLADVKGMPTAIEMLEMARSLQIHTKGTFSKKVNPTNGTSDLICKEEHTPESTKIPRAFVAALRVFDGGEVYQVEMRIQFRLESSRPSFAFTVHRSEEIKRDAFGEMRKQIVDETKLPVFAGSPE